VLFVSVKNWVTSPAFMICQVRPMIFMSLQEKMAQHCHVTFSTRERIAQFSGRIIKIELTNLAELLCYTALKLFA
jgi:hypothetical protein